MESRTFLDYAKQQILQCPSVVAELYLENPARYFSKNSALVHSAIGLASLDLPVLLVVMVADFLVWENYEYYAEYSEKKSWDIAALVKKKATYEIEN